MAPLVVAPLSLFAVVVASGGAIPAVSVVVPADVDCPRAAVVEQALVRVRGANAPTQPRGDENGWTLLVKHPTEGVQVSLRDPRGVTVLSRFLVADPSRCESTAEAIAIVVERYFRDVAWTPDVTRIDHAGPPLAQPATATAVGPDLVSSPVSYFFSRAPRLVVGVGPALWTRGGGVSVALDARARVTGPLFVGIGMLLPPFQVDEALSPSGEDQAHVSGVPLTVRAGAAGARGRFGVTFGLESLLTFERGESRGIPSPSNATRTVLAAGLGLGATIALGTRFRLSADASVFRVVLGSSYEVDGIVGPVLEPPKWQALFGLRLDWVIFL